MKQKTKNNSKTPFIWRLLTSRWFAFAVVCIFLTIITCWRYPTYWVSPNFYAEDGTVFTQTILSKGFLGALFTPFNGYFIFGLYLLHGLGWVINALFLGGNVLSQPQALAVVSYVFWAAVSSLPIILFWREVKHKNWLVLISIALSLVQLPGFNYATLGVIGNYKFAFLFIAFLLLLKRHLLPQKSWLFYLIDAGLLVCAFTNATVYLLLPFALIRYWPHHFNKQFFRDLIGNKGFLSLVALGVLMAAQVGFIALHGGTPNLKGYLDTPFEFAKTIEIVIERTFLFPVVYPAMKLLNDVVVVILFVAVLGVLLKITRREDRPILYFGVYAALVGTVLFVSQRTGVSQFFLHYQSSGTDHFFYAQNWVFLFSALFVLARAAEGRVRLHWKLLAAFVLGVTPVIMLLHNDFGLNSQMERKIGSLPYNAQLACKAPHGQTLTLPVYPAGANLTMPVLSNNCDSVANYIPDRVPLPLTPYQNNYVQVNVGTLQQTFKAEYNQLSGVSVFLSTFGATSYSTYNLSILDASCHQTVRSTTFSAANIKDNSYVDIRVQPITDSAQHEYCFTITPAQLQAGQPPIAEQLSAPDIYQQGAAIKDGKTLPQDVVFDVLYK